MGKSAQGYGQGIPYSYAGTRESAFIFYPFADIKTKGRKKNEKNT
jgi:hypothetical protein